MKKTKALSVSIFLLMFVMLGSSSSNVFARQLLATSPTLGSADSFAVFGATAVTNVPTSTITGDVGLTPAAGSNYVGFGPACLQVSGSIYAVDSTGLPCTTGNAGLLTTAKNNFITAYNDIAGQPTGTDYGPVDNQLGGKTLTPGVYAFDSAATANLIGTLTLNAQGNPYAVWIFKASSTLVLQNNSTVNIINSGQACNVWWVVGSSGTLRTGSNFKGNMLASTSITDDGFSTIEGRLFARTAQVALNNTTITRPNCVIAPGGGGGGGGGGEEEEETTPVISGLPATGGAPIRNHDIPWSLVILGGIGIIPLILGIRDYRQEHSRKK